MNFLAHQYLSMDIPAIKVGNLLGEFVRGKNYQQYPPIIQKGVLLHRKIDEFTDNHDTVLKLVREMNPVFHKYSPVILDVLFDYCLAKNWWRFSNVSLQNFCNKTYDELDSFHYMLPKEINEFVVGMRDNNWLFHYENYNGIQKSLGNLKKRTSFENNIEDAVKYLYAREGRIESSFFEFFPDMINECKCFLSNKD